eukprot:2969818-Pyramimonas_sp.AAC.1
MTSFYGSSCRPAAPHTRNGLLPGEHRVSEDSIVSRDVTVMPLNAIVSHLVAAGCEGEIRLLPGEHRVRRCQL